MKNLVKDASMGPLREALKQGIEITKLKKEDMRSVTLQVKKRTFIKLHALLVNLVVFISCLRWIEYIFFGKKDFEDALQEVRPSVSSNELGTYDEWNKQFGSLSL